MSLPWLKGAISGPIRACGLTVTAAHFSANRKGGGKEKKASRAGGRWEVRMGGGGHRLGCLCLNA